MNKQIEVVSSDAVNFDPNSPSNLMKRATQQMVQSTADTKYDPTPPSREGFEMASSKNQTVILGFFGATSILLLLYGLL